MRAHQNLRCIAVSTTGCNSRGRRPLSTETAGESTLPSPNNKDDDGTAKEKEASSDDESSTSAPVKVSMDELLALASCQPTALSLEDMYLQREGGGLAGCQG